MYLHLDSLHTSHLDLHSQLFIKFYSSVILSPPVLVVLNKLVKTFGEKSNLKCGLIRTRQLH